MTYDAGSFDIAVIGAGHAGIEAALAAARLGCSTIVFTINLDAVGNCPCNPSIGGTARATLSGKSTPWAGRWAAPPTPAPSKAGCSTWARARRCTPCGPRLIGTTTPA